MLYTQASHFWSYFACAIDNPATKYFSPLPPLLRIVLGIYYRASVCVLKYISLKLSSDRHISVHARRFGHARRLLRAPSKVRHQILLPPTTPARNSGRHVVSCLCKCVEVHMFKTKHKNTHSEHARCFVHARRLLRGLLFTTRALKFANPLVQCAAGMC